ncbi:GNAT family N-acetyltransferase [Planococcus sp. YIM B11945]|uniref:GNAT family N-acetyltransferase n=1 Tax=Planococcus sp. YIM B11945 TaxID=3435410 RepID=UPI003D7D3E80
MLLRYKKSAEKIAMGMLAFMPEERDLKKLKQTMLLYQENPDWQLFLWKDEEDFIGLVGVEVGEDSFMVHHLALCPSFRGEGVGHKMIAKIQQIMEPREMRGTHETQAFLNKCLNIKTEVPAPATKHIS